MIVRTLAPKVMPTRCMCVTGLVATGHLWQALAFVTRHPDALLLMLLLSAAATLGASPSLNSFILPLHSACCLLCAVLVRSGLHAACDVCLWTLQGMSMPGCC